MAEAIIETACFVGETDAMLALTFPGDFVSQTLHADEVNVVSSTDNWTRNGHGGSGTIRAEAQTQQDEYSVDIIVRFPGIIKSAIARALSREPRAIVYTSVYSEGEK